MTGAVPAVPGLIIAAPHSGAGKTTVALGIMRALRRRGLVVQPFKCGPDYIDPAFHAAASGRASFNLDSWAMGRERLAGLAAEAAADADIVIAEGVMGLFDGVGAAGRCGRGSTADLAALSGWPAVLVLDVSGQAETAAAVALGCRDYRDDVRLAGVILNRLGSPRQEALIAPAMDRLGLPVLGRLGRNKGLALPERHLGLVQAGELAALDDRLESLANAVAGGVALDALLAAAAPAAFAAGQGGQSAGPSAATPPLAPPGQRIAIAQDRAFSFLYPHILQGWRAAGAQILPFSPLADEPPDPAADAVWLPGGYPELHAGTLAACSRFHAGLRGLAARGAKIHGECGGYMALGAGLVDAEGARHAMAGLLGLETSFARRRLQLGYRHGRLLADSAIGSSGDIVFGHEFHYASILATDDEPLLALADAQGAPVAEGGSRRGLVTGTFFHAIDRAAG